MSGLKLGRLLGGVVMAAVLAGGLAGCGQKSADATAQDGAGRDIVQGLVQGTVLEGTMAAYRRLFPADYSRMVAAAQGAADRGASRDEQVAALGAELTRFLVEKAPNAGQASDARLAEWANGRLAAGRALRAEDPAMCAGYFHSGAVGKSTSSPEVLKAIDALGVAQAEAMAEGTTRPVGRAESSYEDGRALSRGLKATNMSPHMTEVFVGAMTGRSPVTARSPQDQCDFAITYYEGLMTLEPAARGRIIASIAMRGSWFGG